MAAAQLSNDTYIEPMQRLAGKDAHIIRSTHQAAESWAAQKIIYEAKGMTDHITISRTTTTQQARFYETPTMRQEDAFTLMMSNVAKLCEPRHDVLL